MECWLPRSTTAPTSLHKAMRYSSLTGGKRVRPSLVYAAGQAIGADFGHLDGPACAVEFIHAYSLVHDDLPAMDDDAMRRGRPTVHIAFDEATAVLAGDSLQTIAFEIVSSPNCHEDAAVRAELAYLLAKASGWQGMALGQALDLAAEQRPFSPKETTAMQMLKTGALTNRRAS